MAMNPCKNCNTNSWDYLFNDNTRIIQATCKNCGVFVNFKAKPRKPYNPNKPEVIAKYKIIKNKRYLEIAGEFVEVGLYNFGKYWRVCPVMDIVKDKKNKIGKLIIF